MLHRDCTGWLVYALRFGLNSRIAALQQFGSALFSFSFYSVIS
jgi:hypothetical protein